MINASSSSMEEALPRALFIRLRLIRSCLWRWHIWLLEELRKDHKVEIEYVSGPACPPGLKLLLALEMRIYGGQKEHAACYTTPDLIPERSCDGHLVPDLVIDLSGSAETTGQIPALVPLFNGQPGDLALINRLLDRKRPETTLSGSNLHTAFPAIEEPLLLNQALASSFSLLAIMLMDAVRDFAHGGDVDTPPRPTPRPLKAANPFIYGMASFATKIKERMQRLVTSAPAWAVAWRWCDDSRSVHQTLSLPLDEFTRLADDGQRYFADPFVFCHKGRTHVFCEEYPYATGKGIISMFTIGKNGNVSSPEPVLERPYHLSYPCVFEQGGHIWMIPESSANSTLELYRADPFPHRWVREAVLIDNIRADDATIIWHKGRFWIFAATSRWQSSQWDTLSLFHATTLHGPWLPHTQNNVLTDARAARPGGALFTRDGALWRPAQDCTAGYGGGLSLCRVEQLDEDHFAQSLQTTLTRPGPAGKTGLHTLNRAGGLEVIDMFGVF
jgi:hypothetical protein